MKYKLTLTPAGLAETRVDAVCKDVGSVLAEVDSANDELNRPTTGIWFAVVQEKEAYLYWINEFNPEWFQSGHQGAAAVASLLKSWHANVTTDEATRFLEENCDDLNRFYSMVVEACLNPDSNKRMVIAAFAPIGADRDDSWSHEIWAYDPNGQGMIRQEDIGESDETTTYERLI